MKPKEAVQFRHSHTWPSIFYFESGAGYKIVLNCSEVTEEPEDVRIEVVITVNDENISLKNYHWRSEYGVCLFDISPNTDKFKPGLFRVAFISVLKEDATVQNLSDV